MKQSKNKFGSTNKNRLKNRQLVMESSKQCANKDVMDSNLSFSLAKQNLFTRAIFLLLCLSKVKVHQLDHTCVAVQRSLNVRTAVELPM